MATRELRKKIASGIKAGFSWLDEPVAAPGSSTHRQRADRLTAYLKGDYYKSGYDTKYIVNTMYNLVNLILPHLIYHQPHIKIKPKRQNFSKKARDGNEYESINGALAAEINEVKLNNILKNMRFKHEIRDCAFDCLRWGFGVLKVGYSPSTDHEDDNEYLDEKDVFCQRVNPKYFGKDPLASGTHNARYLIHKLSKTLDEVKANPNYKGTRDLKGIGLSVDDPKKKKQEDSKDDTEMVTLYEYHDILENKIHTYVEAGEARHTQKRVLWSRDNPHNIKGSHFVILKFTGDPDDFIGIPMLAMIEDEALAMNEVLSLMMNHLHRFPGQIIAEEGAIDDTQVTAIENGEQGSILFTNNGALRENRVEKVSPLSMGPEYFNTNNVLQATIDKILGIPDFQRQAGSGKRKTATESTFESNDSNVRKRFFLDFVYDFVIETASKIHGLMLQYHKPKDEIELLGDFEEWIEYTKEDIQGEYSYDFDVDTMLAFSQAQAQGLLNFLQVVGANSFLHPIVKKWDPEKVAKQIAKALQVNVEALEANNKLVRTEFDPYEENDRLRKESTIYDPNPHEQHQRHMEVHMQLVQELQLSEDPSDRDKLALLANHLKVHEMMESIASQWPGILRTQPGGDQQLPQAGGPAGETTPSEMEAQQNLTTGQELP